MLPRRLPALGGTLKVERSADALPVQLGASNVSPTAQPEPHQLNNQSPFLNKFSILVAVVEQASARVGSTSSPVPVLQEINLVQRHVETKTIDWAEATKLETLTKSLIEGLSQLSARWSRRRLSVVWTAVAALQRVTCEMLLRCIWLGLSSSTQRLFTMQSDDWLIDACRAVVQVMSDGAHDSSAAVRMVTTHLPFAGRVAAQLVKHLDGSVELASFEDAARLAGFVANIALHFGPVGGSQHAYDQLRPQFIAEARMALQTIQTLWQSNKRVTASSGGAVTASQSQSVREAWPEDVLRAWTGWAAAMGQYRTRLPADRFTVQLDAPGSAEAAQPAYAPSVEALHQAMAAAASIPTASHYPAHQRLQLQLVLCTTRQLYNTAAATTRAGPTPPSWERGKVTSTWERSLNRRVLLLTEAARLRCAVHRLRCEASVLDGHGMVDNRRGASCKPVAVAPQDSVAFAQQLERLETQLTASMGGLLGLIQLWLDDVAYQHIQRFVPLVRGRKHLQARAQGLNLRALHAASEAGNGGCFSCFRRRRQAIIGVVSPAGNTVPRQAMSLPPRPDNEVAIPPLTAAARLRHRQSLLDDWAEELELARRLGKRSSRCVNVMRVCWPCRGRSAKEPLPYRPFKAWSLTPLDTLPVYMRVSISADELRQHGVGAGPDKVQPVLDDAAMSLIDAIESGLQGTKLQWKRSSLGRANDSDRLADLMQTLRSDWLQTRTQRLQRGLSHSLHRGPGDTAGHGLSTASATVRAPAWLLFSFVAPPTLFDAAFTAWRHMAAASASPPLPLKKLDEQIPVGLARHTAAYIPPSAACLTLIATVCAPMVRVAARMGMASQCGHLGGYGSELPASAQRMSDVGIAVVGLCLNALLQEYVVAVVQHSRAVSRLGTLQAAADWLYLKVWLATGCALDTTGRPPSTCFAAVASALVHLVHQQSSHRPGPPESAASAPYYPLLSNAGDVLEVFRSTSSSWACLRAALLGLHSAADVGCVVRNDSGPVHVSKPSHHSRHGAAGRYSGYDSDGQASSSDGVASPSISAALASYTAAWNPVLAVISETRDSAHITDALQQLGHGVLVPGGKSAYLEFVQSEQRMALPVCVDAPSWGGADAEPPCVGASTEAGGSSAVALGTVEHASRASSVVRGRWHGISGVI